MQTQISLVIPRNEYTVYLLDTSGVCHQMHYSHSLLRARGTYENYQRAQTFLSSESLVALIADDLLLHATHGELRRRSGTGATHVFCQYNSLTYDLMRKTQAIWNRAEFRNVR